MAERIHRYPPMDRQVAGVSKPWGSQTLSQQVITNVILCGQVLGGFMSPVSAHRKLEKPSRSLPLIHSKTYVFFCAAKETLGSMNDLGNPSTFEHAKCVYWHVAPHILGLESWFRSPRCCKLIVSFPLAQGRLARLPELVGHTNLCKLSLKHLKTVVIKTYLP